MSRDVPSKHHHEDALVYRALADAGMSVHLMGGMCLHERVEHLHGCSFVPSGARPAVDFLQELDCFYYRTSDRWLEAFGRVVFEAMACGLPVVCRGRGGYADYIAHGVNGFLFDTTDEAIGLICELCNGARLRDRVGRAARHTVEALYGGEHWRRKLAFFLADEGAIARATSFGSTLDPTLSGLR